MLPAVDARVFKVKGGNERLPQRLLLVPLLPHPVAIGFLRPQPPITSGAAMSYGSNCPIINVMLVLPPTINATTTLHIMRLVYHRESIEF